MLLGFLSDVNNKFQRFTNALEDYIIGVPFDLSQLSLILILMNTSEHMNKRWGWIALNCILTILYKIGIILWYETWVYSKNNWKESCMPLIWKYMDIQLELINVPFISHFQKHVYLCSGDGLIIAASIDCPSSPCSTSALFQPSSRNSPTVEDYTVLHT